MGGGKPSRTAGDNDSGAFEVVVHAESANRGEGDKICKGSYLWCGGVQFVVPDIRGGPCGDLLPGEGAAAGLQPPRHGPPYGGLLSSPFQAPACDHVRTLHVNNNVVPLEPIPLRLTTACPVLQLSRPVLAAVVSILHSSVLSHSFFTPLKSSAVWVSLPAVEV